MACDQTGSKVSFESGQEGRRKMEKPRLRSMEGVENNL
jgi:hypothetical protein